MRTEQEKHEVMDRCATTEDSGSRYPGMSYEQGVRDALEWTMGEDMEDHPFEEE